MEWFLSINKSIRYIEDNLLKEITVEDVANQAFSSSSHYQRIFKLVTGITMGEYIRNRRLSLAGRDLLYTNSKVIDIAMKYQYDTSESFSKAFTRFHEVSPSEVKKHKEKLKYFYPLTINISIQGGFNMSYKLIDKFYWKDFEKQNYEALTEAEKYQNIVSWARKAREENPSVFDTLTEWILDDSEWSEDKLIENEQILMQGVFGRFREQNAQLRAHLKELEPSGVVNSAVFKALDVFDDELSGRSHGKDFCEIVSRVFSDFSVMKERSTREFIAGNKTGPSGTDSVDIFGYINLLKDCDAGVQWALFMPDMAMRQQKGFKVESFEYKKMPAMRFIGFEGEEYADIEKRMEKMKVIDSLTEYRTELDFHALLMHHYGQCIDVGNWHGIWGRFMKPNTPVPKDFIFFDFSPQNDGKAGLPYISQFAYTTFSGDMTEMHSHEEYDIDAMYDVTRNIILGQGANIPYPNKYWTAEVFLNGCDNYSTAYMFSAEL